MSTSLETLMEKLTLEEKISLVSGHDMWTTVAIPRLGIPALKVTDGPNGARGGSFSGKPSACFPCASIWATSRSRMPPPFQRSACTTQRRTT